MIRESRMVNLSSWNQKEKRDMGVCHEGSRVGRAFMSTHFKTM